MTTGYDAWLDAGLESDACATCGDRCRGAFCSARCERLYGPIDHECAWCRSTVRVDCLPGCEHEGEPWFCSAACSREERRASDAFDSCDED